MPCALSSGLCCSSTDTFTCRLHQFSARVAQSPPGRAPSSSRWTWQSSSSQPGRSNHSRLGRTCWGQADNYSSGSFWIKYQTCFMTHVFGTTGQLFHEKTLPLVFVFIIWSSCIQISGRKLKLNNFFSFQQLCAIASDEGFKRLRVLSWIFNRMFCGKGYKKALQIRLSNTLKSDWLLCVEWQQHVKT